MYPKHSVHLLRVTMRMAWPLAGVAGAGSSISHGHSHGLDLRPDCHLQTQNPKRALECLRWTQTGYRFPTLVAGKGLQISGSSITTMSITSSKPCRYRPS
jgi:hypothetical protein